MKSPKELQAIINAGGVKVKLLKEEGELRVAAIAEVEQNHATEALALRSRSRIPGRLVQGKVEDLLVKRYNNQ